MYAIGEKTWFKGDEITITTESYELYGGWWQDGVTESGHIVTVRTPEQSKTDLENRREEWRTQQDDFRRLTKIK